MVSQKRKVKVSKVRWQCRRGMLELDMLLHKFYDSQYQHLNDEDKALFSTLLQYPDHDLYQLLMGSEEPENIHLKPIIYLIKNENA